MTKKTTLIRKPAAPLGRHKRTEGGLTDAALREAATQYITHKDSIKTLTARVNETKGRLMEWAERYGKEGDGGHVFLDLPEQVGAIKRIKRERRVSQTFRSEDLLDFLKDRGIYDDVVEMVPTVNQDALARAVFEARISEDELNSFVDEKVSYALVLSKD